MPGTISITRVLKRILIASTVLYVLVVLIVYVSQEQLIFGSEVLPDDFVFNFKIPFKELTLQASDGGRVSAVEFSVPTACASEKGEVVFIHGNGGALTRFVKHAQRYTERCWRTLLFDYRPFGKSRGTLSEQSLFADARAAYDHAASNFPPEKIILVGQSLGSGIAVELAAEVPEKTLVLESPYLSVMHVGEDRYPLLPVSWLIKYPLRSDIAIPKVKAPITIFHGTADSTIPFSNAVELAKLVASKLTFVKLDNATHKHLNRFPLYQKVFNEIFGEAVAAAAQ